MPLPMLPGAMTAMIGFMVQAPLGCPVIERNSAGQSNASARLPGMIALWPNRRLQRRIP